MRDICLKFNSYQDMKQWLLVAGFTISDENTLTHDEISLDIIGIIDKQEGEGDDAKFYQVEGYHANLRVTNDELDLSCLDKFTVYPETPVRVWAS